MTEKKPAHLSKVVLINTKPQVKLSGIIFQNPL